MTLAKQVSKTREENSITSGSPSNLKQVAHVSPFIDFDQSTSRWPISAFFFFKRSDDIYLEAHVGHDLEEPLIAVSRTKLHVVALSSFVSEL